MGVKPPVDRTDADLDPPTLFHICQDYDMIRYFVRTILQFQFAEALCQISGHQGPLHRCDFSGSKEALALKLGQDALEVLTGNREMSVQPIFFHLFLSLFQHAIYFNKTVNTQN